MQGADSCSSECGPKREYKHHKVRQTTAPTLKIRIHEFLNGKWASILRWAFLFCHTKQPMYRSRRTELSTRSHWYPLSFCLNAESHHVYSRQRSLPPPSSTWFSWKERQTREPKPNAPPTRTCTYRFNALTTTTTRSVICTFSGRCAVILLRGNLPIQSILVHTAGTATERKEMSLPTHRSRSANEILVQKSVRGRVFGILIRPAGFMQERPPQPHKAAVYMYLFGHFGGGGGSKRDSIIIKIIKYRE